MMLRSLQDLCFRDQRSRCVAFLFAPAQAQAPSGQPIKIGFSMSLTGPLSPTASQALLGMKIWEEEINAKGGLLGRPVKLVYYDDQSQSAPVPGIYTKLHGRRQGRPGDRPLCDRAVCRRHAGDHAEGQDVHHPVRARREHANSTTPKFFAMIPSGPDTKPSFTEGFFEVAAAQNPKPQTVALIAADQEFSQQCLRRRARKTPRRPGLRIGLRQAPIRRRRPTSRRSCARSRPPTRTSSTVCSYPLDSVGMVQGGQRAELQAEADRRRHGRPAGDRVSSASSARC